MEKKNNKNHKKYKNVKITMIWTNLVKVPLRDILVKSGGISPGSFREEDFLKKFWKKLIKNTKIAESAKF